MTFLLGMWLPVRSWGQDIEDVEGVEAGEVDDASREGEEVSRAISEGNLEEARRLLSEEPSAALSPERATVLLVHALQKGASARYALEPSVAARLRTDIVGFTEWLLQAGADPDGVGTTGRSALSYAADGELLEVMRLLLEAGADPDHTGPDHTANSYYGEVGEPALIAAARGGNAEAIALLLDAGADLTVRGRSGDTALIYAAYHGDLTLAEAALEAGTEVNAVIEEGGTLLTALDFARLGEHEEVEQLLVEAGATTGGEIERLFEALEGQQVDLVREMVEQGVDLTVQHPSGVTVLMVAAYRGFADVVEAALAAGADANAVAVARLERTTALDLAREAEHEVIEQLLLQAGAKSARELGH